MALWYSRESSGIYVLSSKKPKWEYSFGVKIIDSKPSDTRVCSSEFHKCLPKHLHLDYGKGPYKLKPLERA